MAKRHMGPKQQKEPNLPPSEQQGNGGKLSGSHKVKQANHSRNNDTNTHTM